MEISIEIENFDNSNTILDLDKFKEKLHLYDLATEELLNFIDTYMKLYN